MSPYRLFSSPAESFRFVLTACAYDVLNFGRLLERRVDVGGGGLTAL